MGGPLTSSAPAPASLFAPAPAAPVSGPGGDSIVAFEKDGLQVTFSFSKPPGGEWERKRGVSERERERIEVV